MPQTKQILLKPGAPWPPSVEPLLASLLSAEELADFREKGVAVRLVFRSPYPPIKKPVEVPEELLARLRASVADAGALESIIEPLSGAQIIQIGKRYGINLPAKTKLVALKGQLFNALRSEEVWRGIVGADTLVPPER